MSKRNGYKIEVATEECLDEIVSALEKTGLVVTVEKPSFSGNNPVIEAEDAPRAGAAFNEVSKNPGKYIYFSTVEEALKKYIENIVTLKHILSDDTACVTEITEYEPKNDNFVEINTETKGGANAVRF